MGEVDGVRQGDLVSLFGEDEIVDVGDDTLETEATLESVWLPRSRLLQYFIGELTFLSGE